MRLAGAKRRAPRVRQVLSCQCEKGRSAMRAAAESTTKVSEEQATAAAQALVDEAMARNSRDNTTAVVMLLSWV